MRVLLIGGSSANGLGMRELPFGHRIRDEDGGRPEILDLTATGRLLCDVLESDLERVKEFRPDVAVVCSGMTERLVHPPRWFQDVLERMAPRSWHGVAGLEPRAYFSTKPRKRASQKASARAKHLVKRAAMRLGRSQRRGLDDFDGDLSRLLAALDRCGARAIVVGAWQVDERLFPGSVKAFTELDQRLASIASQAGNASFLPIRDVLRPWEDYLDDHLHWNDSGHGRVSEVLGPRVLEALGKR